MARVAGALLVSFIASSRAAETMMRRRRTADETFDPANLKCEIGFHRDEGELASVDFEFFYAMGTTSPVRIFDLEQLLYTSIDESLLWCFEIHDGNDHTTRLGIVTFTPGTKDIILEVECPGTLRELMMDTNATDCRVVRGEMRILAHPLDDVAFAIAGLRNGLKTAMENGLGQYFELPGLSFLSYLADTEEEIVFGGDGGPKPAGIEFIEDTITRNSNERSWGLIFVLIVPVVVLVLLVAFLIKQSRSTTETAHVELGETAGAKDSEFVLAGTGDHPESFHEGLYHYTQSGQQYLSTRCEDCLSTRRDYFFSQDCAERFIRARVGMGTIPEDAPYMSCRSGDESSGVNGSFITGQPSESDILRLAQRNAKERFGDKPLSIDVHKCGSGTCTRCNPSDTNAHQTIFLGLSGSLSNDSFDLFTDDEVVEAYLELVPDQAEV